MSTLLRRASRVAATMLVVVAQIAARPASASWTSWMWRGSNIESDAAVVTWNGGTDVFVIATDGTLNRFNRDSGWWERVPGSPQCIANWKPCAIRRNADQIDVFAVEADHTLYHYSRATSGIGYTYGERLGGYCTSPPAACTDGNRVDCFVLGGSGHLWDYVGYGAHFLWWQGSNDTGGIGISNPAAATTWGWFEGTQPNVVVVGTDHALYHWNGWYGWERVGGWFQGNPAMVASSDSSSGDRLDVACVGSGYEVYHATWYASLALNGPGAWQGWTVLFVQDDVYYYLAIPCGDPCLLAGPSARNRLDAFAITIKQQPAHDGFDGYYWWQPDVGWLPGNNPAIGAPAAGHDAAGNMLWFVHDAWGNLWEQDYIW